MVRWKDRDSDFYKGEPMKDTDKRTTDKPAEKPQPPEREQPGRPIKPQGDIDNPAKNPPPPPPGQGG